MTPFVTITILNDTNGVTPKAFFVTEITERMSYKSFFSRVSVRSVADRTHLCERFIISKERAG